MNKQGMRWLVTALAGLLTACAAPQISTRQIRKSEPAAVALLSEAQHAHGRKAFTKVRDVSVSYEGRWAWIGPRFQPVLADRAFRRSSEERLIIRPRIIAQEHTGPAGKKLVTRVPGNVAVAYNGAASDNREIKRAAALVADAYTLFLLGPFYFDRPGITLATNGLALVDKAVCDEVLAVLRPGFGEAEEDRVILSIDRESKRLRRVRMSLNGLESTRGAEVDVTLRDFRKVRGVLWATDFDERIRLPFDLHAHHWRMLGLEINRGFRAADFATSGFKVRAAVPTSRWPAL